MATLDPKYLAAICVWEGCADFYRDMAYHRGILCNGFVDALAPAQIYSVQHGKGKKGPRSRFTCDWISGPITLSEEELGELRRNFAVDVRKAGLATALAGLVEGEVASALCRQLGGHGLHPRGNFEGFVQSASSQKLLDAHPF